MQCYIPCIALDCNLQTTLLITSTYYSNAFSDIIPFISNILATFSAMPQDNSTPLPPIPYAWIRLRVLLCPSTPTMPIVSASSRNPPSRAGRRPTMSLTTSKVCGPLKAKGNHFAAFDNKVCRISGIGFGFQSCGCFVPPIMVPPSSGRGIANDQEPSAF